MTPSIIYKYFPEISSKQQEQIAKLDELYRYWNARINVISRKDLGKLYEHHVLHSLAVAKFIAFNPGTRIHDAGTGGGFPGIPLAIYFPECRFTLSDSIGKKIKVVNGVVKELGLANVNAVAERMEHIKEGCDFVVSRAVTGFPQLVRWVGKMVDKDSKNEPHNGIIYLKGRDITEELKIYGNRLKVISLTDYFDEEYFARKKLLYLGL